VFAIESFVYFCTDPRKVGYRFVKFHLRIRFFAANDAAVMSVNFGDGPRKP
jgi:hypothetical protein